MATITKSFKENQSADTASTWTVNVTGKNYSVTATDQTLALSVPTATAKYVASGKGKCMIEFTGDIYTTSPSGTAYSLGWFDKRKGTTSSYVTMASNTLFTIPDIGSVAGSVGASALFTSANPTVKSRNIYVSGCQAECESSNSSYDHFNRYSGSVSFSSSTIGVINYACPPELGTCTITKNTSAGYSASGTTGTAKYGGYIKQIDVTIGSQTETKTFTESTKPTSAQTLSIDISNAGTFTPTIKVTDSRDQTATATLDPITVQQYVKPSVEFGVYRCNSSGVKSDEGAYGLITATINYTSAIASLQAPTVKIDGTTTTNVTWYSNSGLTTQITDWSNVASEATVYGLINGSFSQTSSYVITLIAQDQYEQSDAITQTLSTAFYTIDFQAGGKEIAFGAPANDSMTSYPDGLFKCKMDAHFLGTAQVDKDATFGEDVSITDNLGIGGNFEIDSQKPILFKEYDSGQQTLGAQDTTTVDATISSPPSGYIGYIIRCRIQNGTGGSNASGCNPFDYYFADSSTVRAFVRNNFTAQAKVHVLFTVLWVSSKMAGSAS